MCLISQNEFSTWFYVAAENSKYACYLNGTKITAESDYQIPQIVDVAPDFRYRLQGVAGIIPQITENEFQYKKISPDSAKLKQEPVIVYVSRNDRKWSAWVNEKKVSRDFSNHFILVKGFNKDYSKLAYIAGTKLWINSSVISAEKASLAINAKVVMSPDLDACAYKASRMSENILLNQRKSALYLNEEKITPEYNNIYYWHVDIHAADMFYLTDKTLCVNSTCYALPSDFRIPNKYTTYKVLFDYRLELNEIMFPWFFAFSGVSNRVLYSDYPKYPGLYKAYPIIFFFIPKQWYVPTVLINGNEVIPPCKTLAFVSDHFIETGELIYASYISKKGGILHASSKVEIDPLTPVKGF